MKYFFCLMSCLTVFLSGSSVVCASGLNKEDSFPTQEINEKNSTFFPYKHNGLTVSSFRILSENKSNGKHVLSFNAIGKYDKIFIHHTFNVQGEAVLIHDQGKLILTNSLIHQAIVDNKEIDINQHIFAKTKLENGLNKMFRTMNDD